MNINKDTFLQVAHKTVHMHVCHLLTTTIDDGIILRPDSPVDQHHLRVQDADEVDPWIGTSPPPKLRKRRQSNTPPKVHNVIPPFKCKCKTRSCYQNIINDDARLGRPEGTYFDLVNRAVKHHVDPSREARAGLMIHIMDAILPKINNKPVCDMTVHKITGHTKRWWCPGRTSRRNGVIYRMHSSIQMTSVSHRQRQIGFL